MKDNTMIGAALITLASGIVLCFLSFFLDRQHEIKSSVLWYFGQTLLYAASSFGLATYVKAKLNDVTNHSSVRCDKELENLVYTDSRASPAKIWSSANDNKRLPLREIKSSRWWSA